MEKSYGSLSLPTTIQDEVAQQQHSSIQKDRTRRRRIFFRLFATLAIISGVYYYSELSSSLTKSVSRTQGTHSTFRKSKHSSPSHSHSDLESWLDNQEDLALRGILSNIGPPAGAADGLVIASPSKHDPDYFYTWTRDSALTISTLIPMLNSSATSPRYLLVEPLLRAYIKSQSEMQATSNPSGEFWPSLDGLGEPKFMVDGSVFSGSWGRPQRDGPALRALAVIPYLNFLLSRGQPSDHQYIHNHLYDASTLLSPHSLLKADLEYVSHNWDRSGGFDLWEEVQGTHFFGLMVSREAMIQGSAVAKSLGDSGASKWYSEQASKIGDRLNEFWNQEGGYLRATLEDVWGEGRKRSTLDCAVPLALMHGTNRDSWGAEGSVTDPAGDKVLATLRVYTESFREIYGINGGKQSWTDGLMIGRYPEDVYNGNGRSEGNPWYICTFAVANSLRLAIDSFQKSKIINITPISKSFWEDVFALPCLECSHRGVSLEAGSTLESGTPSFDDAIRRLEILSEKYLVVGKEWIPADGSMSEQIGRTNGQSMGAHDLTWSYGSLYDLIQIRKRQMQ